MARPPDGVFCQMDAGRAALMGWNNPPIPWAEFERRLSGRRTSEQEQPERPSSRKRQKYVPQPMPEEPDAGHVPYAELHAHSQLQLPRRRQRPGGAARGGDAARAARRSRSPTTTASTASVRFAEAAEALRRVKTVFGAELSLALSRPQNGERRPGGQPPAGARPAARRATTGWPRAITAAPAARATRRAGRVYDLDELAERPGGDWLVLTGCRKGAVRHALAEHGDRRRRARSSTGWSSCSATTTCWSS